MGYRVEDIDLQEAYGRAVDYQYVLLYMISERIILCNVGSLPEINWKECQEARFFSEDRELHIFEGEEGMQAMEVFDTDGEDIVVKEYELDDRFRTAGKTVIVKEYLDYDSDGQAFVALTRLKGIR